MTLEYLENSDLPPKKQLNMNPKNPQKNPYNDLKKDLKKDLQTSQSHASL